MAKKSFSLKTIIAFIAYVIFFIGITSPFVLLYGPFNNVKKTVVNMVLGSRHKYLAEMFLSQGQLEQIAGKQNNSVEASDENIDKVDVKHKDDKEIERYDIHTSKFDAYLLEIKDPTRIKVACTKYLNKAGQKTSEMAKERKAIAAINGGSFEDKNYAGLGSTPGGFVISNGQVVFKNSDEKCDENSNYNVIAFTKKGTLVVGNHNINDLKALDVNEAVCFRPPTLIVNGEKQITDPQSDGRNPRTAVGQKEDGTVIFLVADGRKNLVKLGASLYDMQEILFDHGAINAGILDGGYSSTMYYNGEVINSPNVWDGERTVATAVYVEP